MGISIRIYIFNTDDSITRIPAKVFNRLWNFDTRTKMTEYSNKKVKSAIATIKLKNRKPIEILNIDYMIITFNKNGQLDEKEINKAKALAVSSVEHGSDFKDNKVINIQPKLALKQYHDRYKWTPSESEYERIVESVFMKNSAEL